MCEQRLRLQRDAGHVITADVPVLPLSIAAMTSQALQLVTHPTQQQM